METTTWDESITVERAPGLPIAAVERRALILRRFALLAFSLHLLLLLRPDSSFLSRPFQEDAFYSLSVARSLAEGTGLSVDGVHATNGVQPLICFLDAPLFAVAGNVHTALRLVMALQALIFIGASLAIAWFAATMLRDRSRRAEIFWLTASVVGWSYTLSNGMMNGLETGLAAGLVFASAAYYNDRIAGTGGSVPMARFFGLGALLGVAVLARIDSAFLVVALLAWHLLRAHRSARALAGRERRSAFGRTLLECCAIGATAVLVSMPWWIYNVTTFGSLLPISGQAQQMLIRDTGANIGNFVRSISDSFLVLVNIPSVTSNGMPYAGLLLAVAVTVLLLTITRGWSLLGRAFAAWRAQWQLAHLVPLLLFVLPLATYYVFFFGAPHFIVRYMVPLRITIVVALVAFARTYWQQAGPRSAQRRGLAVALLIGLAASLYGMSWNFTDHYSNFYMVPARWIEANVRPGRSVAMFQTGTTGFLYRNVVNLDGKVNADALHALQRNALPAYIDSMRFEYLIDWPEYMAPVLADGRLQGRYRPVDTLGARFVVWRRVR